MNLIVDIGNSRIKMAVFHQGKQLHSLAIAPEKALVHLTEIQQTFPLIKNAMLCQVGKINEAITQFIGQHFNLFSFTSATKLPFQNAYKTPETLGLDRLGLVAAAHAQWEGKNALIIDAGTCVTYDFISAEGVYVGGAISPGVQMRYKALHHYTKNLPLLGPEKNTNFIGKNTSESIQSGVIHAIALEIDGFIKLYSSKFENLTVILTGGDHLLLSNHIKNSIFASSNFLLEGLNSILDYNTTQ